MKDKFGEEVEVVFPDWPGVSAAVDMPDVGDAFFFQIFLDVLADPHESILVAAGDEEEFEGLGFFGVGEELGGWAGVGGGGESADPGEGVGIGEAKVEGLASAHGEAGEGAVFAVGFGGVFGFDEGDDASEEVFVEFAEGGGGFEDVAFGAVVRAGASVGHDDDHGFGEFVVDEVVEDGLGGAVVGPFALGSADAVKEVEDGILFVGGIVGRGVDEEFAFVADGFGVVFKGFDFAFGGVSAGLVESGRGGGEGGFVVGAEFDGGSVSLSLAGGREGGDEKCDEGFAGSK